MNVIRCSLAKNLFPVILLLFFVCAHSSNANAMIERSAKGESHQRELNVEVFNFTGYSEVHIVKPPFEEIGIAICLVAILSLVANLTTIALQAPEGLRRGFGILGIVSGGMAMWIPMSDLNRMTENPHPLGIRPFPALSALAVFVGSLAVGIANTVIRF